MTGKVFLITGTSSGFGQELVKVVVQRGDKVVATARNSSRLQAPPGASSSNYLTLDLDVTDEQSVKTAFEQALKHFSRIDVVVNNAGYGLSGVFEGCTDAQVRKQMEVNFFGVLNVTRAAMKVMREQTPSGGLIQQVSSIGGLRGLPTFSIYSASKYAVEGLTESIAHEIKPEWGINLQCVEPGGFRTEWSGRSMEFGDLVDAYDHVDPRKGAEARHNKQNGDPAKGAAAMYELATMQDPPLRCILGSDAYKATTTKLTAWMESMKRFESLSCSTDVDK